MSCSPSAAAIALEILMRICPVVADDLHAGVRMAARTSLNASNQIWHVPPIENRSGEQHERFAPMPAGAAGRASVAMPG